MKTRILLVLILPLLLIINISACKKKAKGEDKKLYDMARETDGFTWYKNSDAPLDKSSGSGHNFPFLRTRFNPVASTMLDADGKLVNNPVFPIGSLIVKELLNNSKKLQRYAVLLKDPDNEFADANGWVWGYMEENGKVAEPASNKGSACTGCHSQDGNADYILMGKFFP